MKIIGLRDGGCIVDISKDELANFMDFNGEYYCRDKVKFEVGTVLKVGEIFKKATEALGLEEEARRAAGTLKNVAMKFLAFYEKPD